MINIPLYSCNQESYTRIEGQNREDGMFIQRIGKRRRRRREKKRKEERKLRETVLHLEVFFKISCLLQGLNALLANTA